LLALLLKKLKKIRGIQKRHNILFRKSHKGKDVKIYVKPFIFDENITSPSDKDYIVWANGSILLETDDLGKAEDLYTKECKKLYDDVHGRFAVGIHALVDGVVKTIGEEI